MNNALLERQWKESSSGYLYKHESFICFFGNKNSSLEQIAQSFPQLHLSKLKQTHSDLVHQHTETVPSHGKEGDAHWTVEKNQALLISTADCVPVLVYGRTQNARHVCAALHAGWRGVASRIIKKTLQDIQNKVGTLEHAEFFIGPHIQKNSFEIGNDVRDQLLQTINSAERSSGLFIPSAQDKCHFDLHQLVILQIRTAGLNCPLQISTLDKDTKTDLNFHSFRRDKELSGRQHSFICL